MRDDVFEEIRRRIDCRDLADSLGLTVQHDYFQCPTGDACPSAKRHRRTCKSSDGKTWHCMACSVHGDAVDLLQEVKGLDKKAAIAEAKAIAGLAEDGSATGPPPPRNHPPPAPAVRAPDLELRIAALTIATDHYDRIRRDGDDYLATLPLADDDREATNRGLILGRRYLNQRGIAPLRDLPIPVGLVVAWRTGLRERLAAEDDDRLVAAAERAGLLARSRRPYERFRGRVWLPWRTAEGRTVNVKGRAIPTLAELCGLTTAEGGRLKVPMLMLRSSNSETRPQQMPKPEQPFGWGTAHEQADQPLIIVEGEIDALSAHLAGWSGVATGGAGGVGGPPIAALASDRECIVLFDGDAVPQKRQSIGSKAAKLARAVGGRWALMPEGDLNDVLQTAGTSGVTAAIREAIGHAVEPAPTATTATPPTSRRRGDVPGRPPDAEVEGYPPGWGLWRGFLHTVRYDPKHDAEEWKSTGIRQPPRIVWRGRDLADQTIVLGLHGKVAASEEEVEIPVHRAIVKTTKDVVPALSAVGMDVDSTTARSMVKYITACEHAFGHTVPFRHGSSQMGWHGGSFLYGDDCMGSDRIHYIGRDQQLVESLATRGSIDDWRDGVLRILEKYPTALFGLYAGMAAPVLRFVPDLDGFAVEYAGASSAGKSTASKAIASAFGNPELDGGILRPHWDTTNALELYATTMNNLPLFLEDLHLVQPPERARDLVMSWVNGSGKGRARRDGQSRQTPRRWSTISVLTGEASVSNVTTYAGVGARLLTFQPPLPRGDVGDPDPAVIADIRIMERTRARNFGHAGRLWVQHLVSDGVDRLLQVYEDWLPTIRRQASHEGPQQRWAKDLALVLAVAQISAPIIGGNEDRAEGLLEVAIDHLERRASPDQAEDAMEMLLAWVAMDAAGGAYEDKNADDGRPRKVWFRRFSDGTICVASQELKERYRREGIYLPQVRRVWLDRGYLIHKGERRGSVKIRLAGGVANCIPVSPVRAGPDFAARITAGMQIPHEFGGRDD